LPVLLTLLAWAPLWPAPAEGASAVWRYQPALAPPPPPGVTPAPYPVPLGAVGQVSFWAPNRGLLITGGTSLVPAGLYAYDGASWHELSSVCGGAKGRIAWAGPDEFWTIADQRLGQLTGHPQFGLEALSLCHFVGAQVVASYALPVGEPDSYMEMDAAACLSASDCWFAGQTGLPPNLGSFHLHWNGAELSTVYDASDHAVSGMAIFNGRLYEGLSVGAEDSYFPSEDAKHPPALRSIAPAGQAPLCEGAPSSFCNVFLFAGQPLPVYPEGAPPDALGGFYLATDGSPLGAGASQLWAVANPVRTPPPGSSAAQVTILRDAKGSWAQIAPTRNGPSALPAGATLSGSYSDVSRSQPSEQGAGSIAPEPGTSEAWLSLQEAGGEGATVALLQANVPEGQGEASATILETDHLPGPQDPVGFSGRAGPIACPAAHDCWMATSEGWLFHLTDGAQLAPSADPLFDGGDGVIAYRPPDSGVPVIYPDAQPADDSLANQQSPPAPTVAPEAPPAKPAKARRPKPLLTHVKSALLHHRLLVISFTLTARAHVRMVGRRDHRVVARTPREALQPGRHRLSLSLDPSRWPTSLSFEAHPIVPPSAGTEGLGATETTAT
jgi:hypothetical protein